MTYQWLFCLLAKVSGFSFDVFFTITKFYNSLESYIPGRLKNESVELNLLRVGSGSHYANKNSPRHAWA
jgi:hypothetical protein